MAGSRSQTVSEGMGGQAGAEVDSNFQQEAGLLNGKPAPYIRSPRGLYGFDPAAGNALSASNLPREAKGKGQDKK